MLPNSKSPAEGSVKSLIRQCANALMRQIVAKILLCGRSKTNLQFAIFTYFALPRWVLFISGAIIDDKNN